MLRPGLGLPGDCLLTNFPTQVARASPVHYVARLIASSVLPALFLHTAALCFSQGRVHLQYTALHNVPSSPTVHSRMHSCCVTTLAPYRGCVSRLPVKYTTLTGFLCSLILTRWPVVQHTSSGSEQGMRS